MNVKLFLLIKNSIAYSFLQPLHSLSTGPSSKNPFHNKSLGNSSRFRNIYHKIVSQDHNNTGQSKEWVFPYHSFRHYINITLIDAIYFQLFTLHLKREQRLQHQP